jgi:hypothetical protein
MPRDFHGPISVPFLIHPKRKKTKKFSPEQDQQIRELVGNQRFPNWALIAEKIEGKTARQCRERYQHYLAPEICPLPWTPEEDELLRELHQEFNNDWANVALRMPGRTNIAVKNRFRSTLFRKNSHPSKPQNQETPKKVEPSVLDGAVDRS